MKSDTGEVLYEKISLIHQAHSEMQADIWLVRTGSGGQAVMRDYSAPKNPVARFLCRWALAREVRVHRMLEGMTGIPDLIRVIDDQRYLIEWIEGQPLSSFQKGAIAPEFFSDLESILRNMHERGVAHGDLRNKNVMVTAEGVPVVIDFSTAWWAAPFWRRPIFAFIRSLDSRRLAKSKLKYCPETLTDEERGLLEHEPWYHRVGHLYRHWLYPWLRKKGSR